MARTYEKTRWLIASEQMDIETRELGLADLLREAREKAGLGVRELERRSGVTAGQISRIESGGVERPSRSTLTALAEALGRFPEPLLYLAGHIDEGYLGQAAGSVNQKILDLGFSTEMAEGLGEVAGDIDMLWDVPVGIRELAQELIGGGSESLDDAQEVVSAWPGITENRRRLVRAFVADQVTLSEAERSPSGGSGRYEISIELTERADA